MNDDEKAALARRELRRIAVAIKALEGAGLEFAVFPELGFGAYDPAQVKDGQVSTVAWVEMETVKEVSG